MAQLNHVPHVRSVNAGRNYYDPVNAAVFEVRFSFPGLISAAVKENVDLLTEQVTNVGGLDNLLKTPAAGQQKFFGADVSYLNPTLDNTYAEITIEFNLNLRSVTDNYVLDAFMQWRNLNYNLGNGARYLKKDYVAPFIEIKMANRDGTVWRVVKLWDVLLTNITGLDGLDITNNESPKLQCTFRSDYWDDSAQANEIVYGPIYMDSKDTVTYAGQTTPSEGLTMSGSEGGTTGTTTKSKAYTESIESEESAAKYNE